MTTYDRTVAQKAMCDTINRLSASVIAEASTNVCQMNLMMLPVETTIDLGLYEVAGDVLVNTDFAEVAIALDTKMASFSLRQARFVHSDKKNGGKQVGLTVGMAKQKSVRQKRAIALQPNGWPDAIAWVIRYGDSTSNLTVLQKHQHQLPFAEPSTLSFPTSFKGREHVSFLGLPKGTIVPLKNGSTFEVQCRANVNYENNGTFTGHLVMRAMDDIAKSLGTSMGWSKNVDDDYFVSPNLLTGRRSGNEFDVSKIRVPFSPHMHPTHLVQNNGMAGVETRLKHAAAVVAALGAIGAGRWAESPEALAAAMEDFLFN